MNWDRIFEALASIVTDPNSWAQDRWANVTECGTTYCFAGHVVHNSGLGLTTEEIEERKDLMARHEAGGSVSMLNVTEDRKDRAAELGIDLDAITFRRDPDCCEQCARNTATVDYGTLAQALLGLEDLCEANRLFKYSNNIHRILNILREWYDRENELLPFDFRLTSAIAERIATVRPRAEDL